MSDNKYTTLENMIRKVVAEADENRNTEMRRKIKNVARPDDPAPNEQGQKLTKQAEIKNKIIDEAEEKKVKLEGGKTEVDLEPTTDDRSDTDSQEKTASNKARAALKKQVKEEAEELSERDLVPVDSSPTPRTDVVGNRPRPSIRAGRKLGALGALGAIGGAAISAGTKEISGTDDLKPVGTPADAAGAGKETAGTDDTPKADDKPANSITVTKKVPKPDSDDNLTFSQAFARARERAKATGNASTGQFTWKGKQYQTNVKGSGTTSKPQEPYVPMSKQKKVSTAPVRSSTNESVFSEEELAHIESIIEADDPKIKLDDKKKTGNIKLDIEKPGRIPTSKAPVYVDPKTGASAARPQGNKPLEGEILPPEKKPKGVGSTATDFDAIRKAAKPSAGDRIKSFLSGLGKVGKFGAGKAAGLASPIVDAEPAGEKPEDLPVAKTIKKATELKGQQRFRPAPVTPPASAPSTPSAPSSTTSTPSSSSPGPVDRPDPYSAYKKDMTITKKQEGDCPPDGDCDVPSASSAAPAQKSKQADSSSTKDMTNTDLGSAPTSGTKSSPASGGGQGTKSGGGGGKPPMGIKPPIAAKPPKAAAAPKEKSGTWYYQDPQSDIVRAWGNTKDGEAPWKPQGAANKEKFTSPGGQLNVGPDTPNRALRGTGFGKEKGPSVKDTSWKKEVSADFPGEEKPAKKKAVKESYSKENPMFKSDNTFGTPEALLNAAKEILEAKHKSEKEKELAAMGHPKDKITKKDVLIARGVLAKEDMFTGAVTDTKTGKKVVSPTATKADEKKPAANVPLPPKRPEMKKEEVEQVNEISAAKAGRYMAKAAKSREDAEDERDYYRSHGDNTDQENRVIAKRKAGMNTAMKKLTGKAKVNTREEVELSAEELARLEEISKGFE